MNMFNQPYVDGSNQPGENLAVVSVDSATHGVLAFWGGNNIHSDLPLELLFVACFPCFCNLCITFCTILVSFCIQHLVSDVSIPSLVTVLTVLFGFVGWKTKIYSFHPLRACRAFAVLLEEPERM